MSVSLFPCVMKPEDMSRQDYTYGSHPVSTGSWNNSLSSPAEPQNIDGIDYYRSPGIGNYQPNMFSRQTARHSLTSVTGAWGGPTAVSSNHNSFHSRGTSGGYRLPGGTAGSASGNVAGWEPPRSYSPTRSTEAVDDPFSPSAVSDSYLDNTLGATGKTPPQGTIKGGRSSQRRPTNRDEFDGPHQFLQKPPPDVISRQERELPHLPTNLHVQEQDELLGQVNDRLSQCAYDFVAKYQFPIPLTQDMRPVERPQDREWTEWVYLLKRLATKRRVPARVLYNGQIKQFVTVLENSLEMRHAAKHQSRPLKDDRNILQLISAGIQVAKILKDASAMEYLDRLYVSTEKKISDRTAGRYHQ